MIFGTKPRVDPLYQAYGPAEGFSHPQNYGIIVIIILAVLLALFILYLLFNQKTKVAKIIEKENIIESSKKLQIETLQAEQTSNFLFNDLDKNNLREIISQEKFKSVSLEETREIITKEYFLHKIREHRIIAGVLTIILFGGGVGLFWLAAPFLSSYIAYIIGAPAYIMMFSSLFTAFNFFYTYSPKIALKEIRHDFPVRKDRCNHYSNLFDTNPWKFWKS